VKQKRIPDAEREVTNALKLNPDQATVRSAANFYVMLYDRMDPNNSNIKYRLDMLRKCLEIDKNYVDVYDRLILFVSQNAGSEESEDVKLILKKSIVDGKAIDIAHIALSSILIAEGKLEEARLHLEQSFSLNPNMPAVCNNLAWIMANREPPNLTDAEQLSLRALSAMPDNPTFHDTLGTIWMKQGKNREAATQLEKAMQQSLPNTGVHLKLADIYQKLGDDPLANLHREKAESLAKKNILK
jgi:Tfp pilus assembly protein PilF